jgi:hypothetical protein
MRILVVISGDYGQRHVDNLRAHTPEGWNINVWKAPRLLPPIVDDAEEFLPRSLPASDLILSLGEHPGVATLLPDIAKMTGAQAVIAPIDNAAWLPNGLARQVEGWLKRMGVASVSPKPFCTLTETTYNVIRHKRTYDIPLVAEFAHHFGRPAFQIKVNPSTRQIASVVVTRDACCGCAQFVAEKLVGLSADEAEFEAGMLHHHYPCQATMGVDGDYNDTLLHVSGNVMKDEVAEQVKPFRQIEYFVPAGRVDAPVKEEVNR